MSGLFSLSSPALQPPLADQSYTTHKSGAVSVAGKKTVWIDLDNSPHVPFFAPIVEELERRGYPVMLTARDCFQVRELTDLFGLDCRLVGTHYGKNTVRKLFGLCVRAMQMLPAAAKRRPALAISHGSRSQLIVTKLLRIPSVMIGDYEFARLFALVRPNWMMVPEVIPISAVKAREGSVLQYPGIKEDVYASRFQPRPEIKAALGLEQDLEQIVVTIRPPATEAHYHVPESDILFAEVLDSLGQRADVKIVLLPRNERQEAFIRAARPQLFSSGKIIIPAHAVDGLNLVWHSDLVISGGGTMNREAAALGVPVYSIFRGKIGAVDRYLAAKGRMTLIEDRNQVREKILLRKRERPTKPSVADQKSLEIIVQHITDILEGLC